MKNFLTTIATALALALTSGSLFAGPLEKTSPEYIQLQAMGYELESSGATTIARGQINNLIVSRTESGFAGARYFKRTRRNLNKDEEFKLLSAINKINMDLSYQVSLADEYLSVALYNAGPYNAKALAYVIRQLEISNSIFDRYPALTELLSN